MHDQFPPFSFLASLYNSSCLDLFKKKIIYFKVKISAKN